METAFKKGDWIVRADGSEVHDAYYNKQEYGLIREYCEKDVKCCAECVSAIEGLL